MNEEGVDEPDPEIDEHGVPLCREECGQFDGKRCRLLGFRPDRICEPRVREMAANIEESRQLGIERGLRD